MARPRSTRTTTLRTGTISNVEDLQKVFASVPASLRGSFPAAVREGLQPIASEMRANARKRAGLLKKSIRIRIVKYASGAVFGVAGPSRDVVGEYRGKRAVPANYGHLVEFGTKPHPLKVQVVGRQEYFVEPNGNRKGYVRRRNVYAPVPGAAMHPGAKPYPFRGPALAHSTRAIRAVEARIEADLKKTYYGDRGAQIEISA